MRIAVVTKYFPTSEHPWAGHSAYQTLRLLAQRHELHVFYPEARYPRLLAPFSPTETHLDPAFRVPGVESRYIPYPALPFLSRAFNGATIARTLLAEVRAWRPDILLNYVIYPDGYAAVRIGQELGVPVVLTAIGSDLNRIAGRLPARYTRQALREAAWTTTVSADLLRTALHMGADPNRATAILNGCDTAIFHPRDRQQARHELQRSNPDLPKDPSAEIILYVGRLDLRKGLAELITAMASLRQRRHNLCCYLVGNGPAQSHLDRLVAQHGLQQVVHFIPPCSTDSVALWMAAADLVALPSYMEGCPNVVIEALACGRPVVATNVGGIPELLDATSGRLIPPRDSPALAAALEEVLTTPWDSADLARRHARSWADVANDLQAVLERTLAPSRATSS